MAALAGVGHFVEAVESKRAASASAGKSQFDIVLCDYRLSDGSGVDLMRELKQKHGLRGICLSGYSEDELTRADMGDSGFEKFLVKGVVFETILRAIEEVAAGSSLPNVPRNDP